MKRILVLLCLFPLSAVAEKDGFPEFFCAPPVAIDPASERCEDNDIYTKSAELCLQRLRSEVNREGETVKRFFSKGPKDRQSQNFVEAQADHRNAVLRLERLIRLAKQTALEVDKYFDAVYYPIDYDLPEVNGGDPRAFMMDQPCYGDTVRALDSIMNDIVRVGRELTAAKLAAESIGGQLVRSEKNINNAAAPIVTGGRNASGAPARVPSGQHPRRQSTITGEIKPDPNLSLPQK